MLFSNFRQVFDQKTREDIALVAIIILVGAASFGLGRLSVTEKPRQPLIIRGEESTPRTDNLAATGATTRLVHERGLVVASKSGVKYHYLWCPGAKTISMKNKITFSGAAEAEEAGYTKASNCK